MTCRRGQSNEITPFPILLAAVQPSTSFSQRSSLGQKGQYTGRDIKQPAACDACDLVLRNHRPFYSLCHFGDRVVRNALRMEMKDDRENVLSSIDFANQRAYVSD